jgi:hypothetical protein
MLTVTDIETVTEGLPEHVGLAVAVVVLVDDAVVVRVLVPVPVEDTLTVTV